jgi:tetratricopeptide (TPR) repeat protein
VSPLGDENDWVSLSSFFAALGRRRDEIAVLQTALIERPESGALRNALYTSLWSLGRADLAAAKARWLAQLFPESAASQWYAGYALMQQADWLRRSEAADASIDAYRLAAEAFEKSRAMKPDYADSAEHYIALAALGRGFAHLLVDRRAEAGQSLVEAIRVRPAIVDVRDSLDREAVDLLDGALEWRASGPSPVDPLALLAELERADPNNPLWADRVADSELREALRADGRADPEAGDRYLDRSIEAARRGLAVADRPETRRALAQSATVAAERFLDRSRPDRARELLREAAPLMGETAPAEDAPIAELVELAARLRSSLGEARPVFRPGR